MGGQGYIATGNDDRIISDIGRSETGRFGCSRDRAAADEAEGAARGIGHGVVLRQGFHLDILPGFYAAAVDIGRDGGVVGGRSRGSRKTNQATRGGFGIGFGAICVGLVIGIEVKASNDGDTATRNDIRASATRRSPHSRVEGRCGKGKPHCAAQTGCHRERFGVGVDIG